MFARLEFYTGSTELQVLDTTENIRFPVYVHYPTLTAPAQKPDNAGQPATTENAPIAPTRFPLVVISHGNGGTPLLYTTISTYLAERGFIVAMPEHYGNNRNNNSLGQELKNLQLRPAHVKLAIDHLLGAGAFSASIDPEQIFLVGHSFGGYTALALAGGQPYDEQGNRIEVEHDERVKALVLLAPAAGWFMPAGALAGVKQPILLFTAEHDPYTPAWNAELVQKGVPRPEQVRHEQVAGAGHFSFLSPFPPHRRTPGFLPATDPEGFNREAFHRRLSTQILVFLNGCRADRYRNARG